MAKKFSMCMPFYALLAALVLVCMGSIGVEAITITKGLLGKKGPTAKERELALQLELKKQEAANEAARAANESAKAAREEAQLEAVRKAKLEQRDFDHAQTSTKGISAECTVGGVKNSFKINKPRNMLSEKDQDAVSNSGRAMMQMHIMGKVVEKMSAEGADEFANRQLMLDAHQNGMTGDFKQLADGPRRRGSSRPGSSGSSSGQIKFLK